MQEIVETCNDIFIINFMDEKMGLFTNCAVSTHIK